ncbi:MAG: hypothetical protein LW832_05340 [Parachlamydia sp.]|jgi:hypothetical protein|nr:hypothetical protein [Parachlamydia sp.]
MEFSLKTIVYSSANGVIGAAAIYHTANRFEWLTAFAVGMLAGTLMGEQALSKIENGYVPRNPLAWTEQDDSKVRLEGVKQLTGSTPGIITTTINAYALSLIQEALPSEPFDLFVYFSAFSLGYQLANFFCLDQLNRNKQAKVGEIAQNLVV